VNYLVLSMTTSAVPLRTRSACHQGPKSAKSFCYSEGCGASNLSNLDSFGILLTNPALFHIVNKRTASVLERATAVAFLAQNKRVSKLTHLPVGRTPKRSRVSATEAGSLDCALAEVGRKERKGLPGFFGFVGFGCPTLHREMPKITAIACCVGTATRSRDSAPMRSIRRAAGVTTPQRTPFPKAKSFAAQLIIFFRVPLHGCISIPAIRQMLTDHNMLRGIARANSPEKIGN
jgi:hypothetical protein